MKRKTDTLKKEPKAKRQKKERSPKDATALLLGCISLGLAVLTVLALLFVNSVVTFTLGICAVLVGFGSLMFGKGGTLPAVVGIGAAFLSILSMIITLRMQ